MSGTLPFQGKELVQLESTASFVMSLVATLGNPVSAWSSPVVRNAWLTVHIVLVLLGLALLVLGGH